MENTRREKSEKEIEELLDNISSSIVSSIVEFLKERDTKISLHLDSKTSASFQWSRYEHYLQWSSRKLSKKALERAISSLNKDPKNYGIGFEARTDVDVQGELGFEVSLAYTDKELLTA